MTFREFRRAGHLPTLVSAFLYFDVSFMVWVSLGALANSIVPQFGLSDAQKGLMVAVPLLGGAVLRLVLGTLTDRMGARRTGLLGLSVTIVPLLLGWLWADSFPKLLVVGGLLGVAGASFAVALPLASRWYPARYQGLAMGIAGAGNSGTALATFFGPRLAEVWGWNAVIGLALVPVLVTLVVFLLCAKDSPVQPPPRPLSAYLAVLRERDTWWFCLFYAVTFGGFVGLASFLNLFFLGQYGVSKVQAGNFTTVCVISGSFLRPLGGYLSDRLGGVRVLLGLYIGVVAVMLALATLPSLAWCSFLLFGVMGLLGMGNGAVFQIVPQRFSREIGVVTGIVGAAGGIGGFLVPTMLGGLKHGFGSYGAGFFVFGLGALGASIALSRAGRSWRTLLTPQTAADTAETVEATAPAVES